ncbi:MAG: hypothetical protein K8S99_18630 [Planctomycetes bacterium]|nr:hypothetical protein [Planctomycetota bacterium]
MTQAYSNLISTIAIVRRGWQVRRAIEGLLIVAAAVLTAWVVTAALDQLIAFESLGRCVLFAVIAGTAGAVGYRALALPLMARHSEDFYAAMIESHHPGMNNRLINALQLGRETAPAAPRLVRAIVDQAAAVVDEIDFARAVASPLLARHSLLLLTGVVVISGYALIGGPGARASLVRVALPWADVPPFTWTTIAIAPGDDLTVLEGSSLEVSATVGGRRPADEASLILVDGRGVNHSMLMRPRGEHGFAYTVAPVEGPFTFYVAAGDARSRRVDVRIEPRPRITATAVTYHYPDYTALPDRIVEKPDGNLNGLPATVATLGLSANKPLNKASVIIDGESPIELAADAADAGFWTGRVVLRRPAEYRVMLTDRVGNEVEAGRYMIGIDADQPPLVSIPKPGRDVQLPPDEKINLSLIAQDDYGLGPVTLLGRVNPDQPNARTQVLHAWPTEGAPRRRLDLTFEQTTGELGLKPGAVLEYWATAEDRNNVATRPGFGESRHFRVSVLTPEQMRALTEMQLAEYSRAITELIRLQRLNRNESAGHAPAGPLVERQALIRRSALQLADVMESRSFVMKTMIDELRALGSGPMAEVIALLESGRDSADTSQSDTFADRSLPGQDKIVAALEEMLRRLTRDQTLRDNIKKMEHTDPGAHQRVTAALSKLARDLDHFLSEQREIKEQYERTAKRRGDDEVQGESPDKPRDTEQRLDRWKQWLKDTVDGLAKLPEGFVKDSALGETLPSIFEEVEKKQRAPTSEVATPLEKGAKVISTKVLEDLEVWMMATGDSARVVMEEGAEGKFEVQPAPLPSNLQDMVGDLIEDMQEFDQEADDVTSTWGGDTPQAGWDIGDGPISSFSATGKTGNQMPNSSEITGRSGAGRRGRSSGQMVGDESKAMEGRPTPARLTSEKYESGQPKTDKQLDPRGATGGGKKTGGGSRGLQGGTPPDFSREMDRLKQNQATLRERAQQLAKQMESLGRSSDRVERALQLMEASEGDLRDLRYDDAARKRKTAIQELKADQLRIDEAVSLSLQKARDLPPDMREQITAGSRQAMPEGFEDLVGAYYKALSTSGAPTNAPGKTKE